MHADTLMPETAYLTKVGCTAADGAMAPEPNVLEEAARAKRISKLSTASA